MRRRGRSTLRRCIGGGFVSLGQLSGVSRAVARVASSQYSQGSQDEASGIQRKSQRRSPDALRPSRLQIPGAGIQESHAQVSGESPWIPASTGMTPLPSFPQNDVDGGQESAFSPLSSHPERPLDASPLPARRSWSVRSLVIMGLVLLVGITLTVQYLSLPSLSTQSSSPQHWAPQALPLPDKPSHHRAAVGESQWRPRARILQRRSH